MSRLSVALSALLLSSSALAVSPHILERGWQPSVSMAGGEPATAVEKMREMADLQRVLLENTEYHQQTQSFVDGLWSSLERFDLQKFYKLLPEENGEWRELKVYGSREGSLYRMGPEATILGNDQGQLDSLGDVAAVIKAKKVMRNNNYNYLLSGTMSVGVGDLQWPSVVEATEETFRIIVEGDESFKKQSKQTPDYRYVAKVHGMNPDLGEEDVAIIAPLWAAFPEMWDLLATMGQVQEVVVENAANQSYQHLKGAFQIQPSLMEKRYPELANHLAKLNSLMKVNMKIANDNGTILSLNIDSESLIAHLEAYVDDGRLLPIRNGEVITNAPAIDSERVQTLTASIDSTVNILGVITDMNQVHADIHYRQHHNGAKIMLQMTEVPEVKVRGFALGFMPTGLINMFMPGSIDELMHEFLTVACKGNDGKGIVAEMNFEHQPEGPTQVHITNEFEGLDNFMVRIGMGIVSDRIIPDTDVSDEIRTLIFDTQDAFSKDLDGFAKVALK